jgi:hypothetical protein
MNRLSNHTTYLMGPMDDPKVSRGKVWREDISKFLWSRNIGVMNPCNKPSDTGAEDDDAFDYMNKIKAEGKYDELESLMSPIVRIDLHMVDLCNFGILKVNKDSHMCGSYGEQTYAALEKKPIIVWCPQGKKEVPNWLFGNGMRHRMFFGSLEEVKQYITHIDTAKDIDCLGRWRFLDYDKIFNKTYSGACVGF